MSVVIKGMEMPRDCHLCPLSHWNKLDEFTGCEIKKRFFSKEELNEAGRPQFCPLIEIPPHGRLIDADAFSNKYFDKAYFDMVNMGDKFTLSIALTNIPIVLNNAPTILEAEVKE